MYYYSYYNNNNNIDVYNFQKKNKQLYSNQLSLNSIRKVPIV